MKIEQHPEPHPEKVRDTNNSEQSLDVIDKALGLALEACAIAQFGGTMLPATAQRLSNAVSDASRASKGLRKGPE